MIQEIYNLELFRHAFMERSYKNFHFRNTFDQPALAESRFYYWV